MWAKRQALILLIAAQAGAIGVGAEEVVDPDAALLTRLESIEELLSNQGLLEMLQQMETLEQEVSRMRGELEVQNHVLEQIKKRQRDLYKDIDRRLQRFENPLMTTIETATGETEPPLQTLSPITDPETTNAELQNETPLTLELVEQGPEAGSTAEDIVPLTTPSAPVSEPEGAGTVIHPAQEMTLPEAPEEADAAMPAEVDPERIQADYQNAFNLLKQSRYDRSITAFREFLARYPDTEYADKAQFWLAEAYHVNSRFDQALVEYNVLLQNYPESRKLAQAGLKAAFCQLELGQIEPAKKQLEELIQQYPGTTAARLAQDRLKKIATLTTPTDMTPANP